MGAIAGYIYFKQPITDRGLLLQQTLVHYNFDKHEAVKKEGIYFEAGIQYNTPESLREQLPYEDETVIMTADAILDNRAELMDKLDIQDKEITDSQIILRAYKKWDTACCQQLLGDYALAIWDKKKERLLCIRDHVGKRSLYYCLRQDGLVFGTLMKPLILLKEGKKKLNDKWLVDFLSIEGPISEIDIEATLYEGIYQLPPGHYLTFNQKGIHIEQYWHPERIPKRHYASAKEYEEAFREIFDEAVKCRLRSKGQVGIMLSSGLDSTAVAAVAAESLSQEGKKLHSFTEIPMAGYINTLSKSQITNEKDLVGEMVKRYPNIDPHFNSYIEGNAYKDIDESIAILEQPYKFVENFYWMMHLLKEAKQKDCCILLDGQFGNYSISQGNVWTYWNTLFLRGHWGQLYQALKDYCRFNGLSRKKVYKGVARKLSKSILSGMMPVNHRLKKEVGIANGQLVKQWQSIKRIEKMGYLFKEGKLLSEKSQNIFITNLTLFSHLGSLETKYGLYYGITKRDPTRDKRVIEFCLAVPQHQYVYKGQKRSLIRRSMKELVPDCIRLNFSSRGKQAADWIQRLQPYETKIEAECLEDMVCPVVSKYLDRRKLKDYLESWQRSQHQELEETALKKILISIIFSRFIKKEEDNPI